MDTLKELGGNRDWERWNDLRVQLNDAYQEEETYWCQKPEYSGLKRGTKILSIFMLVQSKEGKLT